VGWNEVVNSRWKIRVSCGDRAAWEATRKGTLHAL
jgi:hypothetical protein